MKYYTVRELVPVERFRHDPDIERKRANYTINRQIAEEIINHTTETSNLLVRIKRTEQPFIQDPRYIEFLASVYFGIVEIQRTSYQVEEFYKMPTFQVARSAVEELKHRIRSRWKKMWSLK